MDRAPRGARDRRLVARGHATHARRPRAPRPRGASLRADRTRPQARAAGRGGDRRARRRGFPRAGADEVLTKYAIDALACRGGVVQLPATPGAEETVVIRVSDDGPGIPRELRS